MLGSQRGLRSHGETIWETQVIPVVKVVWKGKFRMVMRASIVQKQSRMARFDKTQGMAVGIYFTALNTPGRIGCIGDFTKDMSHGL